MKEQATISVIVPIYNVEPYLRKCLDSIVAQTYSGLEIILVDDGSPDNCGAICDEYAVQDSRIKVIHKPNGGVSSARNAGLDAATGDWIGWVDPDDWAELDMFSYLLENALKYKADIAVCGHYELTQGRSIFSGWEAPCVLDREQAMETLLIADDPLQNFCWDKLWRRELWEGIRFPGVTIFEDIRVVYQLFERVGRIVCLPEAKYYYLKRQGSISADLNLRNGLDFYLTMLARYEEMRENWPQLEKLLLSLCAGNATMDLWLRYCSSPKEERDALLPRIEAFSAAYVRNRQVLRTYMEPGIFGRAMLRLVPYPVGWSFALTRFMGLAYSLKTKLRPTSAC